MCGDTNMFINTIHFLGYRSSASLRCVSKNKPTVATPNNKQSHAQHHCPRQISQWGPLVQSLSKFLLSPPDSSTGRSLFTTAVYTKLLCVSVHPRQSRSALPPTPNPLLPNALQYTHARIHMILRSACSPR